MANITDEIATDKKASSIRALIILTAYPTVILIIGILINVFVFGVNAAAVALPSP